MRIGEVINEDGYLVGQVGRKASRQQVRRVVELFGAAKTFSRLLR